jgi:hypothetical protein
MNDSSPQLQAIIQDFEAAQQRLHKLAERVSAEIWNQRPTPGRWSIAECVAHLNLTSKAFVPLIQDALERAPRTGPNPRRFRRDLTGWLLWKTAGPPVRFRVKTTAGFVPMQTSSREELIAEFDRLQVDQITCVRNAEGYALDRARITSPFDARFRYNLYSCFTILPRHQHRHIWQAEQIAP